MSVDILLDEQTHDIDLSRGIELNVEGSKSLSQKVKVALLLRTNEWGPDINKGVPYSQSIFNGRGNKSFIDSYLQGYILRIPEIGGIDGFFSEILPDRTYKMSFTAAREQQSTNIEVIL